MARLYKSFASIFMLVVLLYFITNSCSDQNLTSNPTTKTDKTGISDAASNSVATASFSNDIGAPIDREKAVRWMNNFANSNKDAPGEYIIAVDVLKSILGNASCVGVAFYYAVDESKSLNIIPIGVDKTGKVIHWKSTTLGSSTIDWATAWQWINNYSGSLRSHFFGSQILVSNYLESKNLRISRAINDAGVPQLLLSNGDVAGSTLNGYSDDSGACPPFCATN